MKKKLISIILLLILIYISIPYILSFFLTLTLRNQGFNNLAWNVSWHPTKFIIQDIKLVNDEDVFQSDIVAVSFHPMSLQISLEIGHFRFNNKAVSIKDSKKPQPIATNVINGKEVMRPFAFIKWIKKINIADITSSELSLSKLIFDNENKNDYKFSVENLTYLNVNNSIEGRLIKSNNSWKLNVLSDLMTLTGEMNYQKQQKKFNFNFSINKPIEAYEAVIEKTKVNCHGIIDNDGYMDILAEIEDVSGLLKGMDIKKLNAKVAFNGTIINNETKVFCNLLKADAVLPISDLVLDFKVNNLFRWKKIVINKFEGNAAKGHFRLKPITIFKNQPVDFMVSFYKLDIEKLVNLIRDQDLDMTGIFDGHLNINYQDTKFMITGGQLAAMSPGGHINYNLSKDSIISTKIHEKTGLPHNYWKNFSYQEFSIDLKKKAKDLVFAIHILGQNKQHTRNFPVKLNLTISLPVESLIKDWQLIISLLNKFSK